MLRWVLVGVVVVGCADTLGLPDPKQLELGAPCTGSGKGDVTECPATTDLCLAYDGSGSDYQCTITCGTTGVGSGSSFPPAPDGGDRLCATLVTTGTAACAAAIQTSPQVETWYCAVVCGSYMGMDYGTCPSGFACLNNYCQ